MAIALFLTLENNLGERATIAKVYLLRLILIFTLKKQGHQILSPKIV